MTFNPVGAGNTLQESRPSFLSSIWNSATSFVFYRQIKDQRFGLTLRYVCMLGLCLSLLISWRVHRDFSQSLSDWAGWLSTNLPEIKVNNGIATIHPEGAKSIADERGIVLFSPENTIAKIDDKYRTGMIVGKDKLILKWNAGVGPTNDVSRVEKLIYAAAYGIYILNPQALHDSQVDLQGIRSFVINPQTIQRWKERMNRWVGIALPLVYFVFYLAGKLLQALFFSLVLAYSHRSMRENGLGYARILNVTLYALTPPALFSAVLQSAGVHVPYSEWIVLGMYVAFLLGAMNACTPPRILPPQDF